MIDYTIEELEGTGFINWQCKFDWIIPSYKITSRDLSPTDSLVTMRFDEYLSKLRNKLNENDNDNAYVVVSRYKYGKRSNKTISLFKIIGG